MRNLCARANARARREREACRLADLLEREAVESRHDLTPEPRLVALAPMLARAAAIATMPLADRLPSRAIRNRAAARICSC
jgi:hypothetical protein